MVDRCLGRLDRSCNWRHHHRQPASAKQPTGTQGGRPTVFYHIACPFAQEEKEAKQRKRETKKVRLRLDTTHGVTTNLCDFYICQGEWSAEPPSYANVVLCRVCRSRAGRAQGEP